MKPLLLLTLGFLALPSCAQETPLGPETKEMARNFVFTEGPVWDSRGFWLFSDIPADTIYKMTPAGESSVFIKPSGHSNGNATSKKGELISCQHDRRVAKWKNGQWVTLVDSFEGKKLNSPNDLAIKSDGSIYFTDPTYGIKKSQSELGYRGLYRLFPSGRLELLDKDWGQPNGICFSSDEKRLYVNDSLSGKLFAFDVSRKGKLTNKTLLATIPQPGVPDGMECDERGRILIAGPKAVWIFSPKGEVVEKIEFPKDPANLAFGGSDGKTLLVTAKDSIYSVQMDVRDARAKR